MINRSFYYLRHGETDENVRLVLQGHIDTELNDNGRRQAAYAADILKRQPIDRIAASSLKRAVDTANIVNQVLQKPISYHDGLRENNFGFFEGLNAAQIKQWKIDNNHVDGPIEPETGFAAPPGGESFQQMRLRVLTTMADILDQYPDENILFVSHGRVFGMLHLECLGVDRKSQNAQPCLFGRGSDQWLFTCLMEEYEKEKAP